MCFEIVKRIENLICDWGKMSKSEWSWRIERIFMGTLLKTLCCTLWDLTFYIPHLFVIPLHLNTSNKKERKINQKHFVFRTNGLSTEFVHQAKVPDTITSWIASAFAINENSGLGVASSTAKVFKHISYSINNHSKFSWECSDHSLFA